VMLKMPDIRYIRHTVSCSKCQTSVYPSQSVMLKSQTDISVTECHAQSARHQICVTQSDAQNAYHQVYPSHSVTLKMPDEGYGQWPIMPFIMQSTFKFWSAAYHTGHLNSAPKGSYKNLKINLVKGPSKERRKC
jgi:hypothetical protein